MAEASATRQTPLTCTGHTRPVPDLQFSQRIGSTGRFFLISACLDGNPMLRDGQTGDWIGTFMGHKGAVWSARLDAQVTRAVTGSADFTAKLWDARTGTELQTLVHKHIVRAVNFLAGGQHVLTGGQEKILRIFDMARPEAAPDMLPGHTDTIRTVLSSDDGNSIITGSNDKEIRVWDRRSLQLVSSMKLADGVTDVEFCMSKNLLTGVCKRGVSFFDARRFSVIREISGLPFEVETASVHSTMQRFVAGGSDFYLHVFDDVAGREIDLYKSHHGPVHCVRFSPDGEIYASGSEDGTIRLWQTTPGKQYGLWLGPTAVEADGDS